MTKEDIKIMAYPHATTFDVRQKEDFFPQMFNEMLLQDIKSFIETNPKDTIVEIKANIVINSFAIGNRIDYIEWKNND